jgi:hypothetical protein
MHLARRSLTLQAQLSADLGGDWGYRRMTTYSGILDRVQTRGPHGSWPGWASPDVAIHGQIGTTGTTAQVQPGCALRSSGGAQLRQGTVTGPLRRGADVVGVDRTIVRHDETGINRQRRVARDRTHIGRAIGAREDLRRVNRAAWFGMSEEQGFRWVSRSGLEYHVLPLQAEHRRKR